MSTAAKKKSSTISLTLTHASTVELKAGHKYLLILKNGAHVAKLAKAIEKYFPEVGIFVLAANDVSDVKIAELVEEHGNN